MSGVARERIRQSGYSSAGFAGVYDAARPRPPDGLLDLLTRLTGTARPQLVVDLGCGTGLSSIVWAGRAQRVIGLEANPVMLQQAVARARELGARNVEFRHGFAEDTSLPEGSADLVTVSQALHWMDVEATIAEAARVLGTGGAFAAYDHDWPPFVNREISAAFEQVLRAAGRSRISFRAKEQHLELLRGSGRFRWTTELLVHSVEEGDADRLVALAHSLGPVFRGTESGDAELLSSVEDLRRVAAERLGRAVVPFHFGYRVRAGVK